MTIAVASRCAAWLNARMRRLAVPWAGVLALSACAAGEPSLVTTPSVTPSLSVESVPPVEAGRVEELGAFVCELEAQQTPSTAPPLRLYATLADVGLSAVWVNSYFELARFRIAAGDGSIAMAEVDGFGTTARGLVDMSKVPLWVQPSRRLVGGMLTPNRKTQVELVSVDADSVVVKLMRHSLIEPSLLPIEERLRCSELATSPPAPLDPSSGKAVHLLAKEGVQLQSAPEPDDRGGFSIKPPVGTTLEAIELERRGGFVRVEVPSPEGTLTGWVAANSLTKPPTSGHGLLAPLGSIGRKPAEPERLTPRYGVSCQSKVRIAADSAHGPVWLGEIREGVSFVPTPKPQTPPGWTPIQVAGLNGHLFIRDTDLQEAGCVGAKP
jgi:hypothetical protein